MGIVKNQHYVPRFYLKYFASSGSKIFCYDKITNKVIETNINNIATEKCFYDLDKSLAKNEGIEDIQHLEKLYSYIESEFAPYYAEFIDRLNSSKAFKITEDDKEKTASYLSTQFERTNVHREQTAHISSSLNDALKNWGINNGHNIKSPKEIHIESILFGDNLKKCIKEAMLEHVWIVLKNNTNIPFLTSDNPLFKIPLKGDEFKSYNGFSSQGIQVVFPLTPNYILVMSERVLHNNVVAYENQMIKLNNETAVFYYNYNLIINSYRQVYSNRKSDIKNMCK